MITKVNPYGHISLTNDYFSGLVEQAAKQCYGIAAMGQAPAESITQSITHRVKDEVELATGLKVARIDVYVDDVIAD